MGLSGRLAKGYHSMSVPTFRPVPTYLYRELFYTPGGYMARQGRRVTLYKGRNRLERGRGWNTSMVKGV